jgi:hypothetical protein
MMGRTLYLFTLITDQSISDDCYFIILCMYSYVFICTDGEMVRYNKATVVAYRLGHYDDTRILKQV